jgi:cytochrome c biogenesis protein CcmG/thiol:disulfide interchange protein DsbE
MQSEADHGTRSDVRRSPLAALPSLIFVMLAVMFAVALYTGDPSRLPSALIGKQAPEMILPPLEGLRENGAEVPGFSTAELKRGEVTAVNFFASWCAPCVQEHPLLMALKQDTGLRIYGVNYKDPSPGGRRFIGRYGNPYAAVGVDANGRAAIDWGVTGMPETFIVNGKGEIVYKHVGPISAQALETKIIPMVRATASGSKR